MIYKEKLKQLRKDKKLTQEKLSKLLGRNARSVQYWEAGIRVPSPSDIRVMAQILKVPVNIISDLEEIGDQFQGNILGDSEHTSFKKHLEAHLTVKDEIYLDKLQNMYEDLKKNYDKVQKEKSDLVQIVNDLSCYVYKKDSNLIFTNINDTFLSYISLSNNDVVGKRDIYKFPEQEKVMLNQLEQRLLRGDVINNEQIVMPGSMGKKYALFSGVPIYNHMGIVKGIIVTLTDITENIKLADRYQLIEQAINKSDDILYIKNKNNNRITFVSKAFSDMTGYHLDKAYNGNNFWLYNVVYEDDRAKVKEAHLDDNIESIKYRIRTSSGTVKHVNERRFNRDSLKFGIIRDITKELEMEDTNKMLLDIIDVMPESIWISNDFGKNLVYISPSVKKLVEVNSKDIMKDFRSIYKFVHTKDQNRFKKWNDRIGEEQWWKSKAKKDLSEEVEFRLVAGNKIKWIRERIYTTPDLKSQGIRFGILKDITKEYLRDEEKKHIFDCVSGIDSMFWTAEILDIDKNKYNFLTVSKGCEGIYGLTRSQIVRNPKLMYNMIFPEDKGLQPLHSLPAKMFSSTSKEYRITKDSETKWLSTSVYKRDNLLFGMTSDITEKKKQNEIKQLFLDIINILPDYCIWIADDFGRNVLVRNRSIESLFGYPEKYFKKFNPEESIFSVVHPDDLSQNKKWWSSISSKKWWDSKDEKHLSEKLEFQIIKKNNDICWIESSVYSTMGLKSKGIRFGVLRDVTKNHKQDN